jgi:hypothetical protein
MRKRNRGCRERAVLGKMIIKVGERVSCEDIFGPYCVKLSAWREEYLGISWPLPCFLWNLIDEYNQCIRRINGVRV